MNIFLCGDSRGKHTLTSYLGPGGPFWGPRDPPLSLTKGRSKNPYFTNSDFWLLDVAHKLDNSCWYFRNVISTNLDICRLSRKGGEGVMGFGVAVFLKLALFKNGKGFCFGRGDQGITARKTPTQGVRGAKAPRTVENFHFLKRFKVLENESIFQK